MSRIEPRLAAAALLLSGGLGAQSVGSYFVNGVTGQDTPTNGGSASSPWKTITYAITRIPPISNPTQWHTLYVEGNQIYSPGTNGETLPIQPSYNLWIEGTFAGHGVMPVIRAVPGGTGMRFAPAIAYERNPSTMRYLVFEGGSYGMTMGNSPNQRHRPRIQDCVFRGQTSAGVRVDNADNSRGIDPRFFQTLFTAAPRGLEVVASVPGAVVYPDVEECRFEGLTQAAIFLDDTSAGGNVGGTFRSNWFQSCLRGVHVRSGPAAMTTNFTVYSCSFADIAAEAVWLEIVRPGDPAATVESSTFRRCGTGVRFSGVLTPGPYVLNLLGNTVQDCRGAGVDVEVSGSGNCAVTSRSNTISGCDLGARFAVNSSGVQCLVRSERERVFGNRLGISVTGFSPSSSASIASSMLCGNRQFGVSTSGTLPFNLRSNTLADNGVGLNTTAAITPLVDHCIFANPTNLIGSAQVSYCCLQGSSLPGTGNLNNTDPQLVRPLYKLSPGSPCIDAGNVATALPTTDYEGDPRASVSRPNGSALPDIGADEYVQLGSARKYGTRGFGLYNFFPQISSPSSRIVIGGSVQIELTGAILPVFGTPAREAILTYGVRDDSGGFSPDLSVIGAPGSLLWNELFAVLGVFPVTPQGTASATLPIPSAVVLVGQTFTFQWFATQRSANPRAPVASDGLRVTVGQ